MVTHPSGAVSTEYRWQQGDDPGRLAPEGTWWVAPGVVAVNAESRLIVDLPHPSTTGELRVSLAGAYLAAPPGSALSTATTDAELAAARRELDAVYGTALFRVAHKPRRLYGALRRRLGR